MKQQKFWTFDSKNSNFRLEKSIFRIKYPLTGKIWNFDSKTENFRLKKSFRFPFLKFSVVECKILNFLILEILNINYIANLIKSSNFRIFYYPGGIFLPQCPCVYDIRGQNRNFRLIRYLCRLEEASEFFKKINFPADFLSKKKFLLGGSSRS